MTLRSGGEKLPPPRVMLEKQEMMANLGSVERDNMK